MIEQERRISSHQGSKEEATVLKIKQTIQSSVQVYWTELYNKLFLEKMNLLNLLINHLNFKVMNLEELNLVELNAQEVQEVEGGILPAILAAIEIAGACYAAGYAVGYFMSH